MATRTRKTTRKTSAARSTKTATAPAKGPTALPADEPAKAAAAVDNSAVRLFQLHEAEPALGDLDQAFEPLQIHADDDARLEVTSFRRLHAEAGLAEVELWGALPADFQARTGLTGTDLRQIIADNPGHDLYFCNPHPEVEGLYHNLWLQGETSHPNFLVLAREFLTAAGLDESLTEAMYPSRLFASGQIFVASPAFWDGYLGFIEHVLQEVDKNLSKTARALLHSNQADARGIHHGSTYLRFILERLFSVYLMSESADWSTYKFPVPAAEQRLNVHLRLLREMKDVALAQTSYWEAACWANYRTLYLMQVHEKEWLQRYLKGITPDVLRFALPVAEITYPFLRTDAPAAKPTGPANDDA